MTDTITAPWSSEQVAALEQFQTSSGMHPFTCGGDRHSLPPSLVPSHSGWYCPDPACDYRQDWAHAFMTDPTTWPKPFGDRHGPTPEEARDAVLAAISNHSAANIPGATTEQLPADVLALLDTGHYLSTACEMARLLKGAIIRNPDREDLSGWRDRMHARCRLNNKFTGELCICSCHHN
ncbi:hypothetical protein ACFYX8_35410 [Streptomyces cyaneofuscatus]|uniref:hypothetical protein n=1 Tax=Streptomyces cyaneofuscatus TaxID=66883 RepID=UPI0036B2F164